jgi:hypothetical protein
MPAFFLGKRKSSSIFVATLFTVHPGLFHRFYKVFHKLLSPYAQFKIIQHPFLIEMHTPGAKEISP